MAEVLSVPRRPDGQSYYSSSSLKRSSPSRTSLLQHSPSYPSSRSSVSSPVPQHHAYQSRSLPSSTPTSAQQSFSDLSQTASFLSTPASSVSFATLDDDQEIAFPSYDEVQFFHQDEPLDLPSSPKEELEAEPLEMSGSTDSTRSDSPLPTPTVADDTAVKHEPSRHVDYLSHDWREEDIWSSWRHIVSQRKVYGQRSRLENASWRTWAKTKNHLSTISPEALNWLKESDVTWLYGPLQPAQTHPVSHNASAPASNLSGSNSFVSKKPILKKRSMSEVMLRRSISASSLLKQAAASVQAQQSTQPKSKPRPYVPRAASDFVPSNSVSNPISRDQIDYFSSRASHSSSGGDTPLDGPKRHIRFDDKVEQCIAVDAKYGDFDEEDDEDEHHAHGSDSESDSSEDGVVMMRRPRRKRTALKKPARGHTSSGKTIEKLPDTRLKYRVESPEITHQPPTPFTRTWSSSKFSPSPSQETLRPSHPSRNFLLAADDDDEDDVDMDSSWGPPGAYLNRKDSISVHKTGLDRNRGDDDDEEGLGMRRTPSGMFMPYEEDEDDLVAEQLGLLGKVNDTINTAKDIAHVIWNVGWRK